MSGLIQMVSQFAFIYLFYGIYGVLPLYNTKLCALRGRVGRKVSSPFLLPLGDGRTM